MNYNPAAGCTRCALSTTRQHVVYGTGPTPSPVMLIGEAPGKWEDIKGVPFVGQAGKLLDSILNQAGLSRSEVYISNNVKCRPEGNRDPLPRESEACQIWMDLELQMVQPRVIVTLGKVAARRFFPHEKKSVAGTARVVTEGMGLSLARTVVVIATYHPAAALRSPNLTNQIISDIRRARRYAASY